MAAHEAFNFNSLNELSAKIDSLGVTVKLTKDLSPLKQPVKIGNMESPNAIAILPMEGCDSNPDGSPSELVQRRYMRLAAGGAGLIWWEACAVVPEGRANELQMMLTAENLESFKSLLAKTNAESIEKNGYRPVNILQLTHSGRYSRPVGHKAAPIIPQHDPILDPRVGIDESYPVATDEYLDSLVAHYVNSSKLAREAGFDGVDIKACHRYLLSELLASHTREGRHGGSFENRTRLLRDIITAVRAELGDSIIIASRFNVFDAHPYPYGFGEDKNDFMTFDPTEPLQLVKMLCESGVQLLSNSAGNPYYIYPQVTRPFDTSSMGVPIPEEHQLQSIERLFAFTRLIQEAAGDIPVIGNGYSWLRQFIPNSGAANIADGSCSMVGIGRQAFAYPDFPRDVLVDGAAEAKKSCIACSKCTQIMRDHGRTGCVIRDSKVYAPLLKEARDDAEARAKA